MGKSGYHTAHRADINTAVQSEREFAVCDVVFPPLFVVSSSLSLSHCILHRYPEVQSRQLDLIFLAGRKVSLLVRIA